MNCRIGRNIAISIPILFMLIGCSNIEDINTPSEYIPTKSPTYHTLQLSVTPTNKPTIFPTITELSTYEVLPTLPVKEAQELLIEHLLNNGNCKLPCLWTISPGFSNYQEVYKLLYPLSSISTFTSIDENNITMEPKIITNSGKISINISLLMENKIISRIKIFASAYDVTDDKCIGKCSNYNWPFFGSTLSFYSLSHILFEYGKPSSVLIAASGGKNPQGGLGMFQLAMVYQEQGMIIYYETPEQIIGNMVLGCMRNAPMELDLSQIGNETLFNENVLKYWNERLVNFKSIEKVTDLSIDKFHDKFRQQADDCINTPAKLWPTEEKIRGG